jgi:multiple sugar transport system permease protein
MILYITITSMIGAFKSYSSIVGLFGEQMGNGLDHTFITVVGYIYDYFMYVQSGSVTLLPLASAAAVILFIIIMIVTFFQMLYNKKKVHY